MSNAPNQMCKCRSHPTYHTVFLIFSPKILSTFLNAIVCLSRLLTNTSWMLFSCMKQNLSITSTFRTPKCSWGYLQDLPQIWTSNNQTSSEITKPSMIAHYSDTAKSFSSIYISITSCHLQLAIHARSRCKIIRSMFHHPVFAYNLFTSLTVFLQLIPTALTNDELPFYLISTQCDCTKRVPAAPTKHVERSNPE